VQIHGGMGFTWEVDMHLALKRAWVLDAAWGNEDEQAEAVAARLV
jgi:alkylation response protein AidB-like acyl-CoA dehydrogenase